jgi:protein-glutamine gamma-glutamyltransferase
MSLAPDQSALRAGNVLWLLAGMAFVIAPHVQRLPIWVTAGCLALGTWRALIALRGWKLPHWAALAGLALAAAAGTWLSYSRMYGRDASSTLLIVMLCLKLLEMRSRRDALLTVFLGFFLVFTNFLYSQTVLMGAYMLACVWIFTATLIGFNRVGSSATWKERVLPAGKVVLQSIPMMLVIFILFPRLSTPLWRLPQEGNVGRTGLSETVAPGDLNKLIRSEAVAFRADFKGAIPRNDRLYWRGPVMSTFDGRAWSMTGFPGLVQLDAAGIESRGDEVDYTVTLEPHGKRWLFALDMPLNLPPESLFQTDYQIQGTQPITALKRYDMRSALSYRAYRPLSDDARRRLTALPEGTNPRAARLAQDLRRQHADNRALINATLLRFNREYIYTLEPPALGRNPVDEFLFETKQGFCEHYASAFVFLMRSAGVPSRVVLGYQGGEVNTVGNYLIVRQADAHAWAEVWLEGEGWVRMDPTAAVSPDRIVRGMDMALGPVGVLPTLIAADGLGVLRQVRFAWDTFNNQWNQWVIGYNTDRQAYFLSQFGLDSRDWKSVAVWMLAGGLLASGGVLLMFLYAQRRRPADPAHALYQRWLRRMQRAGITCAVTEGPVAFLARVRSERPDLAETAGRVVELYVAIRYGSAGVPSPSDPRLPDLRRATAANIR